MTKEELKRKQYDTWNKYYQKHKSEINARRKKVREENKNKLSVAEKRIEELIALINAERERQKKCDDVHLRKIADLEKENTELKSELTKAKEILEELAKMEYVINPPVDKVRSLMVKAEQFLKEIEKC